MAICDQRVDFLKDLFSAFGEISVRPMFGGGGIFHEGVMFAILADDLIYLKTDEELRPRFEAEGMLPFTYSAKGRKVVMSYWELPPRLYDEPEELAVWAERSFRVAQKKKRG
ncbi:MAG: hypothetical protein Kow0032_23440 [Methyloligellaceae bacterium]